MNISFKAFIVKNESGTGNLFAQSFWAHNPINKEINEQTVCLNYSASPRFSSLIDPENRSVEAKPSGILGEIKVIDSQKIQLKSLI